jgi:hypothetical protein
MSKTRLYHPKTLVSGQLYRKISQIRFEVISVIFKCQKSFRCNQILYQKTRNKDDNDTKKCN